MYTKEQKTEYFKRLREQWQESKKLAETDEVKGAFREAGLKISPIGFAMVYHQMRAQGLDGTPYIDAKTFQGWRKSGFKVRKGEHSTLSGITWLEIGEKNSEGIVDEVDFLMPKVYHLFHRTQVEAR